MAMDPSIPSDRDREVLRALVETHVESGAAVGSRTLCQREGWTISPATVRNSLARLEDQGLVEQPHTSAGRVPTDRGYRRYVAQRMQDDGFGGDAEDRHLQEQLQQRLHEGHFEEILAQLASTLGDVSHQLGVVLAPKFERGVLQQLELVQLAEDKVLLVVTIRQGLVRSLVIKADSRTDREELETVSRSLNERLAGLTMAEIRSSVRQRLAVLPGLHTQLLQAVTDEIVGLTGPSGAELHVAGTRNICLKPEFNDPVQVAELMALVERRDELADWLGGRQGMMITIGHENVPAAMRMCSVVTVSYEVAGAYGVIGVIGPTRMPYGRVVNLVSCAAYQAAALAS
jgi:heat-inducible transcriptional repressor